MWGWGDTLGVASPQATHSCKELGLPAVHPHPSCPDLCVLGKKVTPGWPCAHSWQLPRGTSGWGHHCHWEVECWMLRRLPDTSICSFFPLLRLLQPWGGMGMLGPGVTPANWLLLPAVGTEGAGKLPGSLGGGSRVLRPGLPPGFCLGQEPEELRLDEWSDMGSQQLKTLESGAIVPSACPELLCAAGRAAGQGCKCRGRSRSNLLRKRDSGHLLKGFLPRRAPGGLPPALPGRAAEQRRFPGAARGFRALQSLLRHDCR